MSRLDALRILLFAAEALAASLIVPALAALLSRAMPNRAATRRLAWAAVFSALLILPALLIVVPPTWVLHEAAPRGLPQPPTLLSTAHLAAPAAPRFRLGLQTGVMIAMGVWGLGVAVCLVQGLASGLILARILWRSERHGPWTDLARSLPGGRRCELRLSSDGHGPVTWGVLRPVVLLPRGAVRWPPAKLRTVLLHELAHIRRADWLVQTLALATAALYWPSPLVWLAVRALRREAEIAADDRVIASGVRPSDYAETLVSLVRERRGQRFALAMAAPSALSERVRSILSSTPVRTGATPMDALKLAFVAVATAGGLAIARPVIAETPSAPVPPAAGRTAATPPAPVSKRALPPSRKSVTADHGKSTATPMTDADMAKLDSELSAIGPTVDKALADAHIEETVAKAIAAGQAGRAADPAQRAEMDRQLAEIGPRVQKALAEAHIEERVARSLAQIQPRIDAAMAKAQAAEKARSKTQTKPIGEFRIGIDPIG